MEELTNFLKAEKLLKSGVNFIFYENKSLQEENKHLKERLRNLISSQFKTDDEIRISSKYSKEILNYVDKSGWNVPWWVAEQLYHTFEIEKIYDDRVRIKYYLFHLPIECIEIVD